jgi:hypothetical protein
MFFVALPSKHWYLFAMLCASPEHREAKHAGMASSGDSSEGFTAL